jgi:hypothetical protein
MNLKGFAKSVNESLCMVVAMITYALASCAAESGAAEAQDPDQNQKPINLGIARDYTEDRLISIFYGMTASPQSREIEGIVGARIGDLIGSFQGGIERTLGKLERSERKVVDGFDIGVVAFSHEKLSGEIRILSGVLGVSWSPSQMKFGEAEKYLVENILKPQQKGKDFEAGSFATKAIGETVWHRADEKERRYELVFMRGLTIVQLKIELKQGNGLTEIIREKMDAIGLKLDGFISARTITAQPHDSGRK